MPLTLRRHPRHRCSRWRWYVKSGVDAEDKLSIRLVTPDDGVRERLFFDAMSTDDRYKRFFHPKNMISDKEIKGFTHVDYWRSFRIAAVSRATDQFVATACFFGGAGSCVEAAVTVLDAHKGRGLGSLLVDLLFRAAIEEFQATHLTIEHLQANGTVRHIFDRAAARFSTGVKEEPPEDGVRAVTWELKKTVDCPLEVQEEEEGPDADGPEGLQRKFEVCRPAAHPLSLWRFELRMLVSHKQTGELGTVEVRPLTPDDEKRERSYIAELDSKSFGWIRPRLLKAHGIHEDVLKVSEAKMLTHYSFGREFAIAALDMAEDKIVAIARWVDAEVKGEVVAFFTVVESWRRLGVMQFIADVMVQTAIAEGKRVLTFEAPAGSPKFSDFAERVLKPHSLQVRREDVSEGNVVRVVAELKQQVDCPTRLTRLPFNLLPN